MEFFTSPELWVALFTLAMLEIVLGIDNLVFISIAVSKLPPEQRPLARKVGLAFACITRILLLVMLAYLARMDATILFNLFGQEITIRDAVLIAGGLFLLVKGTMEIHDAVEGEDESADINAKPSAVFAMVIAQIAVIDIVFSFDSVITAVGMVNNIPVMIGAILIAVAVMIFASNPIGDFIDRHPSVKMLALAFILLIGAALVADGFETHIDRKLIYFAMFFSATVEMLNLLAKRKRRR